MRPFLTARWESLVLLNYACPRALLDPLVPAGTRLDSWDGEALISLVGFLFRDTRVRGLAIPFHTTFEEVNLRFYVLRETPEGERRRAVVFIREIVPKAAIAFVARTIYGEPYRAVPMSHEVALDANTGGTAEYRCRHAGGEFRMAATVAGAARASPAGSEAEFITEHYWGYTRRRYGHTTEYRVEHPRWALWSAPSASFSGPAASLYGPSFAEILSAPPRSAFVAVGSDVAVYPGRRLNAGL